MVAIVMSLPLSRLTISVDELRSYIMNIFMVTMIVLAAPVVLGYDEKYDKIDVDKILADDNLFSAYINCMLDKAECTVEHSADFKQILPEVIATSCAKCTAIQKTNIRKTVNALSEKRPDEFNEFRAKYDPKGEFEKEFTAFILAKD